MYHIEIKFGHNRFDGEPLAKNEVEAALLIGLAILSEFFGGGDWDLRVGAYKSPDGLMFEPSSVLMADAQNIGEDCIEQLKVLASVIAKLLHQRCVFLSIKRFEGIVCFVKPFDEPASEDAHPAA
jgi:hypothetical protein